jgi:5'-3' exonuclease
MAKKHILLVDGNSIAHANHNGTKLTVGGFQVQAIFGVLKSLRALMQRTPGHKELLVLWDGKAQFRLDLYPAYKGNRAPMDAEQEAHQLARKKQMPFLEKALSMLGVRQLRSPLLEADDLAGHLIPLFEAKGHQVTMVSGDKDWLQMVSENVTWFDPIKDRTCTALNFLEFTAYFNTRAFVQGKALQGDGSDNINGIPFMGDKTASEFLAKWKDVNSFFAAVDKGEYAPKKCGPKAKRIHPEQFLASPEGRAIFERNVKLMDWKLSRRPAPGELIAQSTVVDVPQFQQLCERLAFASILREFTSFLRAFNINYEKTS